ncbi:hypothetical protein [Candidatus Pantoea multigeneris]|uniref:Uncharacterized protein n=1 Tax=Candidatus Pantoea multigeneris TaxID=2608357 RepID=A0ABX0REZ5_9GAMM|nr:hypothetical protein [Pantoea multigeneris]NIF23930.1 hypothetical protein [Pantoea multigeneris]
MVTYREIEDESKEIVALMASSEQTVPRFFSFFKWIKYHFFIYVILAVICLFELDVAKYGWSWLLVFSFGLLNWFFISAFVSSYSNMFSMLESEKLKDFKLCKILARKIKTYGVSWFAFLILMGAVGVFTELNVAAIVIGNFVFSIFCFFIFNIDISRYQISGLLGAISAVKEKLSN